MLKALVFDFDGLILDTEGPVFESWRRVFSDHGQAMDAGWWESIIGTAGHADPMDILEAHVGPALDRDALTAARRAHRDELLALEEVLPGVVELLEEAAAAGWSTAIASSSPPDWVEEHLVRLALIDRFAHLSCCGPHVPSKPDPHLYRAAVDALGVRPTEAVALEDSANGIAAAKAAGLWCVAVPHELTRGMDLSGADWVVESLEEVSVMRLRDRFDNC